MNANENLDLVSSIYLLLKNNAKGHKIMGLLNLIGDTLQEIKTPVHSSYCIYFP